MIIGLVCVLFFLQNNSVNMKQDNNRAEGMDNNLENNKLHNGTTGRIQEQINGNKKIIKSIEERNKKEQEAEQENVTATGKKAKEFRPYLTSKEYQVVKKSINGLSEEMNWDAEITFNDYEHVKEKVEEILRLTTARIQEQMDANNKIISSIEKRQKKNKSSKRKALNKQVKKRRKLAPI